jgi:Domain of unknown function (DUF4251)
MKHIIITALVVVMAGTTMKAQDKNAATIQQMVESQNYIFKARSVSPQLGGLRQLSSDYDLAVTKDTVTSYLPYFGRAYTAPVDPSEAGIKFTSTKFEYTSMKKKKDSWEIAIRPKDASDVQVLYLTIYDNGNADLRVSSNSRQSISFNGYIIEGKPVNKKAF